jgi:predicted hotdog family 3-hydroxylacyl-ACP dehydratase
MSEAGLTSMPTASSVIPHRGDALLIDRIDEMDGKRLLASLTVRRGTAFSDSHDRLPGWAAPEIMAQAVAAFAGCRSLRRGERPMPMGLLLGVRQFRLDVEAFGPGEELRVEVLCTSADDEGHGVFDCKLHSAAGTVAVATLTAFQPQNLSTLHSLLAAG